MASDEGEYVPGKFDGLTQNMQVLVHEVGFPDFELKPEEQEIYDRVRNGQCMMCAKDLGTDALFTVNRHGIVAGFCGGVCEKDMGVLGFLQEQLHDLNSRIDFREGDSADGPDPDAG